MVEFLGFMADELASIDIPYEFGEWTQEVSYPYFVGSYSITQYRYEDGYTGGIFTLDGWARGSGALLKLTQTSDAIQKKFDDLTYCSDKVAYLVSFESSQTIPTGEDELYRISITLNVNEWKGEE